jgi:hypothetical protein
MALACRGPDIRRGPAVGRRCHVNSEYPPPGTKRAHAGISWWLLGLTA